ncbi:MAG TPA: SPOR domain-containing protein [Bacteroidia bacterium]|nr:SPOR domain-containing protein [Bacteroidia bacterium]
MMFRKFFLLLLILAGSRYSFAQQSAADSLQKGVECDPRVKSLVEKDMQIKSEVKEKGYRVQIFFGTDKAKAKDEKARFLAKYGTEVHAYEVYEVPNFKIRVGDFRTRLEAYRFLKEIKGDFPTAFIVESDIEFPDSD